MRRRIFILLITLCLLLTIGGCGTKTTKKSSKPVIGFSQAGIESRWRKEHTKSIRNELEKKDYQVLYRNSFSDPKRQLQDVKTFIAYQVDLIILAPILQTGWDTVLEEAKEAGIPVILVDRNIQTNKVGLYFTQIGSSFKAQGNRAGLYAANRFNEATETVDVLELRGAENTSPNELRHDGFIEAAARNPQIQITETITGDYIRPQAKELVADALASGKLDQIDVLFSHNDEMTFGALEALEERPDLLKKLVIISIDAQPEMVELLKKGQVNCVVECNPEAGWFVANTVKRYFSGDIRSISKEIYLPETSFTDQMDLKNIRIRSNYQGG